jgi:hypothetical protein
LISALSNSSRTSSRSRIFLSALLFGTVSVILCSAFVDVFVFVHPGEKYYGEAGYTAMEKIFECNRF